ncbi:DUF3231 family protein [Alteribacillus bidgolensis]|uniref:DUF3231 family protein n=1 Tax=Alteribacillus bidgolensis TaxID=930129 RepID=A0A1G8HAJ1_9BACI|nr:DUF3231 family protein [Alteribacillus bidgolensis]SDI03510.1 Protein of unknown function [Alteribacillus bidgolensis]
MQTNHDASLTSAEISQLWGSYQNDTLAVCVLRYFLEHVEDNDIRTVLKYALEISQSHVKTLTSIFSDENFPIPVGFTENDVNVNAPRLYSDAFVLFYLQQIGKLGLNAHSVSTALSARPDLHQYFMECLNEYGNLHGMANDILLAKGLYVRPPYMPYPDKVDFVTKQRFLSGWFGKRRPLVSLEISNLHDNIQRNSLGTAMVMGFSQVATSKNVSQYMVRGKEIAAKHTEIFGSILREGDIPVPVSWDSEVTTSTTAPFSDKLMMFHTTALIAIGMGYYGTSMATTMRRDIQVHYSRLTMELGKYAEDGANIMIENGWMENPPQAPDRNELAKK